METVFEGADLRAERERGRLVRRSVMALIFFAWCYGFFPNMMSVFQNGRNRVEVDKVVPPVPIAQLSLKVLFALFVGLAVILILSTLRQKVPPMHGTLLVVMLPFAATLLSALVNGENLSLDTLIYPLTVVALWRAQVPVNCLVVIGWLTVAASATSLALGLFVPDVGTTLPPIVGEKAYWPTLLAGPYAHPNVLGLGISMGLPFIFLIRQKAVRITGLTMAFLCVVWSGNRCSILAAVVCVIVCLAIHYRRKTRAVPALATAAGVFLVVYSPLTVSSAADYSYRGQIWTSSFEYWTGSPILGLGPTFYGLVAQYGNELGLTAFSGHNALVHLLTTGGLLLVATVASLYWVSFRRALLASSASRPVLVAFVVMLVFNGWLQNTVTFINLTELAFVGWIPLAVLLFARRQPESASVEGENVSLRVVGRQPIPGR